MTLMAAGDSITILSTEPGVELELAWRGKETVHVTIRDKGLAAESDVWWNDHLSEPASLARFFEDMAANWKGWTGTKEWRSAESPFLSGSHDGLAHLFIDVELRSGWYEDDWGTRVRITLDAGTLDKVASSLGAFLGTLGYEDIVDALRKEIPEFGPAIEEHITDNFGEALPHVLFGDLARLVEKARSEGNTELVARCLSWLEHALLAGDDRTKNLVAVSFVENIGPWDPEKAEFIDEWPPALRAEAEQQKDWEPN